MTLTRLLTALIASLCLYGSVHSARAQESTLGVYAGAGVGSATVRQDAQAASGNLGLSHGALGWDVFLGLRPSRYLGAEVDYFDFGKAHRYVFTPEVGPSNQESSLQASSSAVAGFAVGYLPLEHWWDLYAKAGLARLHKSWDYRTPIACDLNICAPFPGSASSSASGWGLAYGVGTQWKFGALAVRLEYDRINASRDIGGGDPDLLSVGLSWALP